MGIGKNNKCTPTEYVVIYLKSGLFIFDKKGYNKGTYVKEYVQCIYKHRFKIRTFFCHFIEGPHGT